MPSSLDPSDAAKPQLRAVRHRRRSRRQAGDVSVEDGSSLKPPSPSPSSSRSASRSPSAYDFLYTPEAAANLVNFVDFLGREHVTVEKEVLLESPKLIGAGTTMNVFAGNWNSRRVAVKSLKPERKPVRDIGITLEQDTDYRLSTRDFYTDVQSVMQEVLIMSREPICGHRNIVRLLAVSWDGSDEEKISQALSPLLVLELASDDWPTIPAYYENASHETSYADDTGFICDIADGLSALHRCGVIHGDLKPENILLFEEPSITGKLVAKLNDFGFSKVSVIDDVRRGRSRHWDAPECLKDPGYAQERVSTSDVYSFGLVAMYIGLGGGDPLKLEGLNVKDIERMKTNDEARVHIEAKLRAHYQGLATQDTALQSYISLMNETLESSPKRRLASLDGIRWRLTKDDPYAKQRKQDKFKFRPFGGVLRALDSFGNFFAHASHPFPGRILDHIPLRIKKQLLQIVGETPVPGEPHIHEVRRLRLQMAEKASAETETDPDNPKVSVDGIRRMLAYFRDASEFMTTVGSLFTTFSNAESDFLALDDDSRPELFKFIDGNDIKGARSLLEDNPSLVSDVLPDEGWTSLHLAAKLGRATFIPFLVNDHGIDPDVRCGSGKITPLQQAVSGRSIEAAKALLDNGADINLTFHGAGKNYTALEFSIETCMDGNEPNEDALKMIRFLLSREADYLRNFDGSSIAFSAVIHEKLLRVFLTAIGPEDAHQLVHVYNAEHRTMLHLAVMLNRLESVKLLLEYGADPSAKNLDGQTPLLLLNLGLSLVGTAPWLLIQAITLLSTKMLFDQDQASAIRELLEERGSRDKDMVDDISSRNEIEKIISNFKSGPRIGETIGKMINTWGNTPFDKFMKSDNPFARKMRSIDDKYVFWALCQALLEWDAKRKEGSISKDELPDGWSDFFEEWNRETKGSLTQWMQDNQIPEITKILKGMAVSACEWAVDKNVPDILAYVTMMVSESMRTGAFGELVTHGSAAAAILFGLFQSPELFSFTMKVLFLQRLKKLWKAMKKGELLDILHDLVVRLGMCEAFDNISEVLVLSHLKTGPKPPILLVEDLSLPTRYPGSAVFVTSTNHYPAFVRVALTLIELFIFLFPLSYLLVVLYCLFHATIYEATWKVCLAYHAISAIPDSWVCCDENFRLHPNIPRGMQAAWELILFRLRHGFPAEEPFIISFRANSQHHVDIPTRMASMYKGALWPLYWLPLRRDAVVMPVPCYSAMRVLLSRWKKGRLPRKAWGDGWWELLDGKGRIWKRVNLKERPTWSEYTKASEEIQKILNLEDKMSVYFKFLEIRDYFLETPAQQLRAMTELFGREHSDCTDIWRRLYISSDESEGDQEPIRKKWKPPGWLNKVVYHCGLDRLVDLIPYAWDDHLLDETFANLQTPRLWEHISKRYLPK